MALVAGRTTIGLKDTSQTVSVPEDNRAKLMYYLNSICGVLELDDPQIARLRSYNNYHLSDDETDALLLLCYLISPDELIDKCLFHSEELCGDSQNKFFDLSQTSTHLAVTDSVLIGGERKQVKKIMTFKMAWIQDNWAEPIKALVIERQRAKRQKQSSCCVIL